MKADKSISETEVQFAGTCLGKNLGFGYGWLASHRGEYRQARKYFQAASILLHGTVNRLLWAHLEILSSSCRRKELGPHPDLDSQVIPPLHRVYKEVQANAHRQEHSRYAAFAAYELGMAFLYLSLVNSREKGRLLSESLEWHDRLTKHCSQLPSLAIEAMLLSSRIHWFMGDEGRARTLLQGARAQLGQIHKGRKALPEQWARILVFEAELEIACAERNSVDKENRIRRAIRCLDEAVQSASDLPLTSQIVNFHRARCAYLSNDELTSLYLLRTIHSEHGWLRQQVKALTDQIAQSRGLLLVTFDKGLTRDQYLTATIEPWLVRKMKSEVEAEGSVHKEMSKEIAARLAMPRWRVQRALGAGRGRPRAKPLPPPQIR